MTTLEVLDKNNQREALGIDREDVRLDFLGSVIRRGTWIQGAHVSGQVGRQMCGDYSDGRGDSLGGGPAADRGQALLPDHGIYH